MTAYVRRKRWEARTHAVAAVEVQAAVLGGRPRAGTLGPDTTKDGERIQRVSTKNGLAAMMRRGG
jgi:hypothetical protein